MLEFIYPWKLEENPGTQKETVYFVWPRIWAIPQSHVIEDSKYLPAKTWVNDWLYAWWTMKTSMKVPSPCFRFWFPCLSLELTSIADMSRWTPTSSWLSTHTTNTGERLALPTCNIWWVFNNHNLLSMLVLGTHVCSRHVTVDPYEQLIIDTHNKYRREVGSSNMQYLVSDPLYLHCISSLFSTLLFSCHNMFWNVNSR